MIFRPADVIRSWFNGLEMIAPGLVPAGLWPNDHGQTIDIDILGGLAQKRTARR